MNKINVTTVSAVATSATVVQAVIPEYQKSKAVIRRFSALGQGSLDGGPAIQLGPAPGVSAGQ